MKWKTISSTYIHDATWFTARKDICERPDGKIIDDYYVFEFPEWVTALPVTEDGKIIMVKQYRHALGEVCIELPGGCVDAEDADYETAIKRELLEETGYVFEEFINLGDISSNPSTNTNLMHMFLAKGGKKIQGQQLDVNEEIEIVEMSVAELVQLVEENKILQSMHLSAIFYGLRYLNKISYK